jgi:carbamoyltransferase
MRRLTGTWPSVRWVTDYLGPASGLDASQVVAHVSDRWHWERPSCLGERLADLIAAGRTVGLAHGRSEFGPRAFGNRSILADPRRPDMRDHVNRNIKGREWFRPLAPVVPIEDAGRYFVLDRACPFMQWTVQVRTEWRDKLASIVHVDGSTRLQTVSPEQNCDLYQLLKFFGARTGIPVLLNTSLNGQDEPLVESEADALRCFNSTALDVLAIPPILISKTKLNCLP